MQSSARPWRVSLIRAPPQKEAEPEVTLKPILDEAVDALTQGMRQAMEFAVPVNDEQTGELWLANNLSHPPDYTAVVVGHFLRKLYTDLLEKEFPERLQALIVKLDAEEKDARDQLCRVLPNS
jgi:hypothetical protein